MMKLKNKLMRLRAFIAVAVVSVFLTLSLSFTSSNYFEISKNMDIFASLYKELNTYYVDDVEPSKLMRTGIDAMLSSLDPYTNFISEAEMEGYRLQTTGKYGGIGAIIRQIGENVIIAEPYAGYPADKAGLLSGDRIAEIDGREIVNRSTDEVSRLLKGQPGTTVQLKVIRPMYDGTEKEMNVGVLREEIKINNVPFYGMVNNEIGYIRLANFTEKAGKEVKDALDDLKSKHNLKGVILDVRGNPGGLLNEAVNVTNVFVEKGQEVVSTRGKVEEWEKSFKTLNNPVDIEIPLVVLTNGGSASASEIVAGAIQDLDRGVVVGQRSFGKGLVQTTRSLTYNTKLKVTTAKYYIPSGRSIQAINYGERDEDGIVKSVPDSLKTAHRTKSGRIVYDGAGIEPDLNVEQETLTRISRSLLEKNLIFNFGTLYRSKNEKIAPAKDFTLTEKDYQDFVKFLENKDYDYVTESEELVAQMEEITQKEKYYSEIQDQLSMLKSKVQHSKERDLVTHKDEIIKLLEQEIVGRYYYREGRIESSFKTDNEILKAVNVLQNPLDYTALLKSTNTAGSKR